LLPKAVLNLVVSVATEDIYSAVPFCELVWPGGKACVAYHFAAESLLLLGVSTSQ
jgi:hypothetical protein